MMGQSCADFQYGVEEEREIPALFERRRGPLGASFSQRDLRRPSQDRKNVLVAQTHPPEGAETAHLLGSS